MHHHVLHRRDAFATAATLGMAGFLTPVSHLLAAQEEQDRKQGAKAPAQSVILLWLSGGPSQLETFDPHPGASIAGGTTAIDTAVKGVQLAKGYEQLAAELGSVALVRSLVSKEGDHERGTYTVKTGYRPDATLVHPSIGAVACHKLPATAQIAGKSIHTDIPRHVSILPNQWPGRGGYLGDQYDAFKTWDPVQAVPDVTANAPRERSVARLNDLDVVEQAFSKGRLRRSEKTLHRETVNAARTMMTSDQLAAFDVRSEPKATLAAFGDTPFGRGCLAARRLIEQGVRCVEVTLNGWDTHANNHNFCTQLAADLDPAFAALLRDLRERGLLERTMVLCVGEFGRTPRINGLEGRDHWPHNFTLAAAGGGIVGGRVIGETDPEGGKTVKNPVTVGDVHATVLKALGIDWREEVVTPIGRPMRLAEGEPIADLLG